MRIRPTRAAPPPWDQRSCAGFRWKHSAKNTGPLNASWRFMLAQSMYTTAAVVDDGDLRIASSVCANWWTDKLIISGQAFLALAPAGILVASTLHARVATTPPDQHAGGSRLKYIRRRTKW